MNQKHNRQYTVKKVLILLWYYLWGHVLGVLFYKKRYYYGKYYKGRGRGVAAPGWRWICIDTFGRKYNPGVPWPCSPQIRIVGDYHNISFHPDDINNFQGIGNIFQVLDKGHISIGKGTWIASNVSIITTNHSIINPDEHDESKDVNIGEHCWIGVNSVILPGVELGPHTVVGAGSIVTKSFIKGNCVVAGNPAKIIKVLNDERFVYSPEQNTVTVK